MIYLGLVKINEEYFVNVSDTVLTLQRNPKDGKDGRIRYEKVGYFHNWEEIFEKLLKIFIATKIDDAGIVELNELKQICSETRNQIKEVLKKNNFY